MGIFADFLGTLRNTFRVNRATVDASGLTVARTVTLPDKSGTVAMVADLSTLVFRLPHTFAVSGDLTSLPVIVPFSVPVPLGQTVKLVRVRHSIDTGTSISVAVKKNGVNIAGLSAVSVTTTPTSTDPTAPESFADNDECSIVLSLPSGTPKDLSLTLYFTYTGVVT